MDADTIILYGVFCLDRYQRRNATWVNDLLKEYYKDDFEDSVLETWKMSSTDFLRYLSDNLRNHSVFVPSGIGVLIPDTFATPNAKDLQWTNTRPRFTRQPNMHTRIRSPNTTVSSGFVLNLPTASPTGADNIPTVGSIEEKETNFTTVSHRQARTSYSLIRIMKIYVYESQKFSSSMSDDIEHKLKISNESCEQCSVADNEKPMAFSLHLSGIVLEYYFPHVKGILVDFDGMVAKIRERFLRE